jgi:hypothetical protein
MEVPYFGNNPYAALSILVAPAILTSASSVLCLGTANRLARVVDRTRMVSTQLVSLASDAETTATFRRHLEELQVRWSLVLRALICFYMSIGSFAAAALISLVGSFAYHSQPAPRFQLPGNLGAAFRHCGCR